MDANVPPDICETTLKYINCVYAVAKCWKRSGFGELMYLDPVDIEKESQYKIEFAELSLYETKWAIEIYERITLENVKQNNDNATS